MRFALIAFTRPFLFFKLLLNSFLLAKPNQSVEKVALNINGGINGVRN